MFTDASALAGSKRVANARFASARDRNGNCPTYRLMTANFADESGTFLALVSADIVPHAREAQVS